MRVLASRRGQASRQRSAQLHVYAWTHGVQPRPHKMYRVALRIKRSHRVAHQVTLGTGADTARGPRTHISDPTSDPEALPRFQFVSELAVRDGVGPPSFRFSGGLAGPGRSIPGCLSGPFVALATRSVQVHRRVSTAVVSTVLARSAASQGQLVTSVADVS